MQLITTLTNDVKQKHTIKLPDNTSFVFQLEYIETLLGWFYTVQYNKSNALLPQNARLITHFNVLHQYRNVIPFGISVSTIDLSPPLFINDFISGRVVIEILTSDEISLINNQILGYA